MQEDTKKQKRLIIVSNRLPVSIHRSESGLKFHASTGGLATGLSSLHTGSDTCWIGWPGRVGRDQRKEVEEKLVSEFGCFPVFLSDSLVEKYYEGYSNRTIWPIFHSFTSHAKYSASEWEAYRKANHLFFLGIEEVYRPGDIIWVHDYQLMLLPRFLRERFPDATIGFFLHIPFPHSDIFRLLPQQKEILENLMAVDLIGFHTHDYAQAFLGSVRRLLGYDNTLGQIMVGDRAVQVEVFPMGIDFAKYATAPSDPSIKSEIDTIEATLRNRTVVFSVSRLDYTKGIPESLEAISEFLLRYPQWHGTLVYVLVVVPSRERVERYASLKRDIDQLVGRINSTYGTVGWQPVRYIYRNLSFGELTGLYASADVALITPLRDGMNLIAKEYVAVKGEGPGVLVLSEFAGAAKELQEAIIVNPNSREDVAEALHKALGMPEDEQRQRNTTMRQRLETHDIRHWVQQFLSRLRFAEESSRTLAVKLLDSTHREELMAAYAGASRRLLLLDYDGTLVPFASEPGGARPDPEILNILQKLCSHIQNTIVIVSGRDRTTLDRWLGRLGLTLVAEHGGWIRPKGREWAPTIGPNEEVWKRDIRPIMQLFVGRIPGSLLEEKDFSLVWHYRKAESESAANAARELLDTLANFTTNLNIQVLPGNKTVEVRHIGINKGIYYSRYHSSIPYDFILAMGDDWTDEDLFAVVPPTAYSIKVTPRITKARLNVKSVQDVRQLLEELAR